MSLTPLERLEHFTSADVLCISNNQEILAETAELLAKNTSHSANDIKGHLLAACRKNISSCLWMTENLLDDRIFPNIWKEPIASNWEVRLRMPQRNYMRCLEGKFLHLTWLRAILLAKVEILRNPDLKPCPECMDLIPSALEASDCPHCKEMDEFMKQRARELPA